MKQEIEDVTVLSKGQGARLSDGTTVSRLELSLDRMGVRVDVVLEADRNYSETFSGVTFSNLADIVPLTANYNGTITRNTICLLYTSPSPRDRSLSRMPSSA